jgi:hypothetical protein
MRSGYITSIQALPHRIDAYRYDSCPWCLLGVYTHQRNQAPNDLNLWQDIISGVVIEF